MATHNFSAPQGVIPGCPCLYCQEHGPQVYDMADEQKLNAVPQSAIDWYNAKGIHDADKIIKTWGLASDSWKATHTSPTFGYAKSSAANANDPLVFDACAEGERRERTYYYDCGHRKLGAWVYSHCDNDDKCDDCCSCEDRITCYNSWGSHQYHSDEMSQCEMCEYCEEHCKCPSSQLVPGWQQRDKVDPADFGYQAKTVGNRRLNQAEEQFATIDPVQAMADFYLTDYVMALHSLRGDQRKGSWRRETVERLAEEAAKIQRRIVRECDKRFRDYVFLAVGGEVRHHPTLRTTPTAGGGRNNMWRHWILMGDLVGRQALLEDAAELFNEKAAWHSGFGGRKWAVAAEIAAAREAGKLDARTFVDRVFTLQHNGGSLLNKMVWATKNRGRWRVDRCQLIGAAHAAAPTRFDVLLFVASDDVRRIFAKLAADPQHFVKPTITYPHGALFPNGKERSQLSFRELKNFASLPNFNDIGRPVLTEQVVVNDYEAVVEAINTHRCYHVWSNYSKSHCGTCGWTWNNINIPPADNDRDR